MKWTEKNQLQLNPSKSGFLSYKDKNDELDALIVNNKDNIEKSMKLLGFHILYDMNWDLHIKPVAHKIIPYCYGLLRTNTTLNVNVLKSNYFGYKIPV